jgi:hypothetical protein
MNCFSCLIDDEFPEGLGLTTAPVVLFGYCRTNSFECGQMKPRKDLQQLHHEFYLLASNEILRRKFNRISPLPREVCPSVLMEGHPNSGTSSSETLHHLIVAE